MVKLSDLMTTYVGSSVELKKRLREHKCDKKLGSLLLEHLWMDENCYLEKIEVREVPGTYEETKSIFESIEFEWIAKLRAEGYIVLNNNDGRSLDKDYQKNMSAKNNAKNKESGQAKIWCDKNNAKNKESGYAKARNENRHRDYVNWQSKICKDAKKEGLTSQEYRIKNNIPDYDGPKKKLY